MGSVFYAIIWKSCWGDGLILCTSLGATGYGVTALVSGYRVLLEGIFLLCDGFVFYFNTLGTSTVLVLGSFCTVVVTIMLKIARRCINASIYLLPSFVRGILGVGFRRVLVCCHIH